MLVFTFYSGLHFVPLPGSFIASQGLLNSSSTGGRELENRWVEGRRVGLGGGERDREKPAKDLAQELCCAGNKGKKNAFSATATLHLGHQPRPALSS